MLSSTASGFWYFLLLIFILLITISYLIFWIFLIVDSYKRKKWIWFALLILNISVLIPIIYFFAEYKKGRKR